MAVNVGRTLAALATAQAQLEAARNSSCAEHYRVTRKAIDHADRILAGLVGDFKDEPQHPAGGGE